MRMRAAHLGGTSIVALAAAILASSAQAQTIDLPTVTVSRGAPAPTNMSSVSQSVTAQPANSTVVTSDEIKRQPITSYGDIFRPLPGFNISNYGQGVVGYGLSLRGFTDGEHGRDISYYIDGIPLNEVSSMHTPNYADLNVLIPESVDHIDVVRGPFSVEYGDSNVGGSVNIITKRAEPYGTFGASAGSFGTLRSVATYSSTATGSALPFAAFDAYRTSGYARNSEVDRINAFAKATFLLEGGAELSVRGQAYKANGGAPGYINLGLVNSGALSSRAATNPTDGSDKVMQNLVANYVIGTPDQQLNATLYVNHDNFSRWADFGGGQRAQTEERTTVGGALKKVWTQNLGMMPTQFLLGAQWRTDQIDAVQGPSAARQINFAARTMDLGIRQTDLATFAQLQIKPIEWIKLTGGIRYDQFYYNVSNNLLPTNSPNASPNAFSPKAGISITPTNWLEVFANYGEGFRSPNATSDLLSNPNVKPFTLKSQEAGVRATFERVTLLADVWQTDISNEIYQPAPGLPVQNLGRSRRRGVDFEGKYYVYKDADFSFDLFANYSPITARLLGQGAAIYVDSVPQSTANIGFDFDKSMGNGQRFTGQGYVTFIGKKYLANDASITTTPYTRVSAKLGYSWNNGWDAFAQATYYPGSLLSEAAFNFGPSTGATSADVFVRPVARFSVMAGANYKFKT